MKYFHVKLREKMFFSLGQKSFVISVIKEEKTRGWSTSICEAFSQLRSFKDFQFSASKGQLRQHF